VGAAPNPGLLAARLNARLFLIRCGYESDSACLHSGDSDAAPGCDGSRRLYVAGLVRLAVFVCWFDRLYAAGRSANPVLSLLQLASWAARHGNYLL